MKRKKNFTSIIVLLGVLLLAACGEGKEEIQIEDSSSIPIPQEEVQEEVREGESENQPKEGDFNESESDALLDSSDLQAMVKQFSENGFSAKEIIIERTEGGGMKSSYNPDDEPDLNVTYTDETIFEVFEFNSAAYNGTVVSAGKEAVLNESNVFLWGEKSGDSFRADRVLVWQTR